MTEHKVIAEAIEKLGCDVLVNEPMKGHTTFRIGGEADIFAVVHDMEQLTGLLALAKERGVRCRVIGNGSNMLVSDGGLRGIIAKLEGDFLSVENTGGDTLKAGAGALLSALCNYAQECSLSGLEFAWGIPGSVGGAAFMNAGAYGGEMKDVIEECEFVRLDGERGVLKNTDCGFVYRGSVFQNSDMIITSVKVRLIKGDKDAIKAAMTDILGRRKAKQPIEFPSAGSVFKRPVGYYAGGLIEQCGLKGFSIGGAQVSEKHAGFIINKGGATCGDVLALVSHIKNTVKKETGVDLECEIKAVLD